jgi:hypothetical protein
VTASETSENGTAPVHVTSNGKKRRKHVEKSHLLRLRQDVNMEMSRKCSRQCLVQHICRSVESDEERGAWCTHACVRVNMCAISVVVVCEGVGGRGERERERERESEREERARERASMHVCAQVFVKSRTCTRVIHMVRWA